MGEREEEEDLGVRRDIWGLGGISGGHKNHFLPFWLVNI